MHSKQTVREMVDIIRQIVFDKSVPGSDSLPLFEETLSSNVYFITIVFDDKFKKYIIRMTNLKEIKPLHHLQLLKTFPKTTPKQSRRRTFMCESGP